MKQIVKNLLDNYFLVYIDKLLQRPNIENGLIEISAKKIRKAGDYIHRMLGKTNSRPIKSDGDFESFLSKGERQNAGFERMWCVSENGICNPIETNFNYLIHLVNNDEADDEMQELVKIFKHFGLIVNDKCLLDTPYVAVGSGTTKRGNGYKQIAHFIRKNGLIPKGSWPKYNNWTQLYYPKGGTWTNGNRVPAELLATGRKIVEFVDITYEWIPVRYFDEMVKRGAFGTSCYAWLYPDSNGIYRRVNFAKNHAIQWFKKKDKTFKKIGDSYIPFIKKLALDYDLGYGMLLSFGVKKPLNVFNVDAIKEFKKKKEVDYILLVENCKDFTRGLYKIENESLEKIELPKAVDEWIKGLKKKGELIGINSDDFSKLIT